MELPKSWTDLAIWLGVQFPMLAVVAFSVWWVGRKHVREIGRLEAEHEKLLAEKEKRIADRDQRVRDLEVENRELKNKLSRAKKGGPPPAATQLPPDEEKP